MRILRITLIILTGLLLSLTNCAGQTNTVENPASSSNTKTSFITTTETVTEIPSSPLRIYLTFSKYPELNEPVYLTCAIYSINDASNCDAQIKLPEGAAFISGTLEWQGDLIRYYERYFTVQILFNESGNQTIEATASHIINGNNSWNAQDVISLYFGLDGFLTSTLPDERINRYAVINTNLEMFPTPKLNEPVTLSVTITSPVDVPKVDVDGLKAVVIFSRQEYEFLEGNNSVPVTIKAGESIHLSLVVAFKKTGPWIISACVTELVIKGPGPLGIYYYSPQDTVSFSIIE